MTECPSCKERLSEGARACACGWRRVDTPQSAKDPQCTFNYAGMRCKHPCGFYDTGAATGWCIFHRASQSPELSRDIVNDSQNCTPEQYLEMAKRKTYGKGDSYEVARIRETLKENTPKSAFGEIQSAMEWT